MLILVIIHKSGFIRLSSNRQEADLNTRKKNFRYKVEMKKDEIKNVRNYPLIC